MVAIHLSRKTPTNHCRGLLLSERIINQIVIWRELIYNEAKKLGEEISGQRLIIKKFLKDLSDKTQ